MEPIFVFDIPSLNDLICNHFYIDSYHAKEGICFVTVNEEGNFTNTILKRYILKNSFCKTLLRYDKKIKSVQLGPENVIEIKLEDIDNVFNIKIKEPSEIIDIIKTKISFNNPNLDQFIETFEKLGEKVLLLKSQSCGIVLDGLVGELEMSTFERDGYKIHLLNTSKGSILLQAWEEKEYLIFMSQRNFNWRKLG